MLQDERCSQGAKREASGLGDGTHRKGARGVGIKGLPVGRIELNREFAGVESLQSGDLNKRMRQFLFIRRRTLELPPGPPLFL